MTPQELLAVLERNLERLLAWIRGIDAKIGVVFAINMAMLGVLAALAPHATVWTNVQVAWSIPAAVAILASLMCIWAAVFPQLDGPKQSLIYFGGIAQTEAESYRQLMHNLSVESYVNELASQCHTNAKIANIKYRFLRHAMIATSLSLLPWLVAVYQLYAS